MHKNCFIGLITLVIIFLSLMTTGCATKKSAWGDLRSGLILKYQLPRDRILTYKSNTDSAQNLEVRGQSINITSRVNGNYSIKGTGFDDQKNLMAKIIINDLNFAINGPQGNVNPDTSGLKGKTFNTIFSPDGKQLKVTGTEDLPKITLVSGTAMDIKDLFDNILPRLPAAAIKTGESWTTPIDRNIHHDRMAFTVKGQAVNVLEGIETVKGMECVKIKTRSKGVIEGSRTQTGKKLNAKGTITATSIWYFAYKKGIFVKLTADIDENIKITLGAMEIPLTGKIKAERELVL